MNLRELIEKATPGPVSAQILCEHRGEFARFRGANGKWIGDINAASDRALFEYLWNNAERLLAVVEAAEKITIGAAILAYLECMPCFKDDRMALLELRAALAELGKGNGNE